MHHSHYKRRNHWLRLKLKDPSKSTGLLTLYTSESGDYLSIAGEISKIVVQISLLSQRWDSLQLMIRSKIIYGENLNIIARMINPATSPGISASIGNQIGPK